MVNNDIYKTSNSYEYLGLTGEQGSAERQKCLAWFRREARAGSLYALHYLGFFYLNGRGVRKNKRHAASLIYKAAKQNYMPAKTDFLKNNLVENLPEKKKKEARVWLRNN